MVQIVASVDQWGIDPLSVELFNDADSSQYTVTVSYTHLTLPTTPYV